MPDNFKVTFEQFDFEKKSIQSIPAKSKHGLDWPIVYILSGSKEAYVGETQNAYDRMNQHFSNRKTSRKNLTKIHLVQSESFNKSAILDIENMLITHMHADSKFVLQNANEGQSKLHNYYQRSEYQKVFSDIWGKLKTLDLVDHSLYEIENSDIFKFSPYKLLTAEQYKVVEDLLEEYCLAIQDTKRKDVVVKGGAGTGKSLIAIYFINKVADILSNNFDYSDDEFVPKEDSFLNKTQLIKCIKEFGNNKIGFVVPVPSFRKTVKSVFRTIKELRQIKVISPSEAAKGDFDVLIVDEAHRLKRRNKLTNYGTHDIVNSLLNLPIESTELDWLKLKANKMLILFYDPKQSVKESDVNYEDFKMIAENPETVNLELKSQLRVRGGNEYIDFVHSFLKGDGAVYNVSNGYDVKVFDDCNDMVEAVKKKNSQYNGLCRTLAGLSFEWESKVRDKKGKHREKNYDFIIDGHEYKWNSGYEGDDYITNDKNIDKIGCIYDCQGHDLNYAGVIFGPDIGYDKQKECLIFNVESFNDRYSKSSDVNKTVVNIINAYLVLLTRGMYGTYIYAVDENLREHIKSLIR